MQLKEQLLGCFQPRRTYQSSCHCARVSPLNDQRGKIVHSFTIWSFCKDGW